MKSFFILLSLLIATQVSGKIRLIAVHKSNPKFIECQKKSLDVFLKDEDGFEFIVINDALDREVSSKITETCKALGIRMFRYKQRWHPYNSPLVKQVCEWEEREACVNVTPLAVAKELHPDIRASEVLSHVLENFAYEYSDIVGLINEDLFLVKPLKIRTLLGRCQMVSTLGQDKRNTLRYISPALCFINFRALPHPRKLKLGFCLIDNHYAGLGSESYYYLVNHPQVDVQLFPTIKVKELKMKTPAKLSSLGYNLDEIRSIFRFCEEGEFHIGSTFLRCCKNADQISLYLDSLVVEN